jgi:2'-5' RNA ligase
MAEMIRTFIAIELPPAVRQALDRIQERLKRERLAVRWVAPEKIHLTLKFLGEIPTEQAAAVGETCALVATAAQPFELEAVGLGAFPNPRRPRNLWVGLAGDLEPLGQLQADLEGALAELGFPPEGRPFHPHLTLGRTQRRARPDEIRRLGQAVSSSKIPSLGRWQVKQIVVMRSDLRPQGPLYTPQRSPPASR